MLLASGSAGVAFDSLSFQQDGLATPAEAVAGADFVQESVPERLELKHALYTEIEPALKPAAIIASSTTGLTLPQMQAGWRDPTRFVLGHPLNPPHLIPLVEVMGNDRTHERAVEGAERFYQSGGKITIRVNKEMPGHVANGCRRRSGAKPFTT